MRNRALLLLVPVAAGAFSAAPAASLVTMDWVPIGNPGNPADTPSANCFAAGCGSVSYSYFISKYEVTNAQYVEFLNAKAATDSNDLYNTGMESDPDNGGITRSGSSGGYAYSVKSGFADKPVTYVSFYDSLRFANWLNNGQGSADTETGAYTISLTGITDNTITRNELANTFLPSENEWYKAAYYSPGGVYFDYPAGTDSETVCAAPTATANRANCDYSPVGAVTTVGAYTGSASPYGTYDQGGNVFERSEQIMFPDSTGSTGIRGGSWVSGASDLAASNSFEGDPTFEGSTAGFRIASLIPEPSTGLLVMTGLLGLAYRRRRHGRAA